MQNCTKGLLILIFTVCQRTFFSFSYTLFGFASSQSQSQFSGASLKTLYTPRTMSGALDSLTLSGSGTHKKRFDSKHL